MPPTCQCYMCCGLLCSAVMPAHLLPCSPTSSAASTSLSYSVHRICVGMMAAPPRSVRLLSVILMDLLRMMRRWSRPLSIVKFIHFSKRKLLEFHQNWRKMRINLSNGSYTRTLVATRGCDLQLHDTFSSHFGDSKDATYWAPSSDCCWGSQKRAIGSIGSWLQL